MTVTRPLQSEMAAWDGFLLRGKAAKESAVIAGTSKCREKEKQRNYDYHIKRRVKERI